MMKKLIKINLVIGIVLLLLGIFMLVVYPFSWTQDFSAMSDKEILIVGITDGSLFTGFIMLLSCYWMNKRIRNPVER